MDSLNRIKERELGSYAKAQGVNPREILIQRGWTPNIVARVLTHASQGVIEAMIRPAVVPWMYHRGVGTTVDNYDPRYVPHYAPIVWVVPSLGGFPIWEATKPEGGFLLRMQLPTFPDKDRPETNLVRSVLREASGDEITVPDDRLFIDSVGFAQSEVRTADPSTKVTWFSYDDAVKRGLVLDLGSDDARDSTPKSDAFEPAIPTLRIR